MADEYDDRLEAELKRSPYNRRLIDKIILGRLEKLEKKIDKLEIRVTRIAVILAIGWSILVIAIPIIVDHLIR